MGVIIRKERNDEKRLMEFERKVQAQFRDIPPAVEGRRLLMRGTPEWDEREMARRDAGCKCLSFGTITDSNATNGVSAYDPA